MTAFTADDYVLKLHSNFFYYIFMLQTYIQFKTLQLFILLTKLKHAK